MFLYPVVPIVVPIAVPVAVIMYPNPAAHPASQDFRGSFSGMAVPARRPMLYPDMSQQENMKLVIQESLEVAFLVCNVEFSEFSLAKIFDLFDQIFPTALVLNTAYWPFYNSLRGQSICICGKYGLLCRHFKNHRHWLDLTPINHDNSAKFYPTSAGPVFPASYIIEIQPLFEKIHGYTGYEFTINITIQTKRDTRGRPRRRKDVEAPPAYITYPTVFMCRYEIQSEYYPTVYTIIFESNIFCSEHYRQILRQMPIRAPLFSQMFINRNETCAIVPENMLHHTLILKETSLPSPVLCLQMQSLSLYPHINLSRNYRPLRSAHTQTESDFVDRHYQNELERYRQIIGNIAHIWEYTTTMIEDTDTNQGMIQGSENAYQAPILEEVITNDDNNNMLVNNLEPVVENMNVPNVITKSLLDENQRMLENIKIEKEESLQDAARSLDFVKTADEDYDQKWPTLGGTISKANKKSKKYKDVVTNTLVPNQGCKKKTRIPVDESEPSTSYDGKRSKHNNALKEQGQAMLMSAIQSPIKKKKIDFTSQPEYQWFERQVERRDKPDSPLSISDEFEIIDEMLREDFEKDLNK